MNPLNAKQTALVEAAEARGEQCAQVASSGDAYTYGELVTWRGHCTGLVTVIRLEPTSEYFVGREDVMTNQCFERHFRKIQNEIL